MNKTQKIALYGVLTALALILSYVESQIPPLMAIPGMKLGLTNIVVLVALYNIDEKGALAINAVRIIIVSILFGTAMSLAFSLSGGILSYIVMVLLKKTDKLSITGVSIAGGVSHNIGQILIAMVLLHTHAIAYYLPLLWLSGIISGLAIGIVGALICSRLPIRK